MRISPTAARIEAAAICQLKCPLCPTHRGENEAVIGRGTLKSDDFKGFIDANPQIRAVELGNFGEVFLNKELPEILEYTFEKGVVATIDEGANLNTASDEALEALVKYQVARVRCAVDGVTQRTYEIYRAGGNLRQVLGNIQKINAYKQAYQSDKPELIFQFIIFSHNENQIEAAAKLAKMLDMEFYLKLNWDPDVMAVMDRERIRQIMGYVDRKEYLSGEGEHYMRHQCYELWHRPQVNWDGKLLGCSRNFWGVYAQNVFETSFEVEVNNQKIQYARDVLMGRQPHRDDMPCVNCGVYQSIVRSENWITKTELANAS
jgi:MoaA/NifB/PqqE/SkfB family radical SAM enzyme